MMIIKEKLKLVTSLEDIFKIKVNRKFKKNNKCYILPKYLNKIFYFYYSVGLPVIVVGTIFLLVPHFSTNFILQITESILIYIICEYLLIFIIPIKETPCGLMD